MDEFDQALAGLSDRMFDGKLANLTSALQRAKGGGKSAPSRPQMLEEGSFDRQYAGNAAKPENPHDSFMGVPTVLPMAGDGVTLGGKLLGTAGLDASGDRAKASIPEAAYNSLAGTSAIPHETAGAANRLMTPRNANAEAFEFGDSAPRPYTFQDKAMDAFSVASILPMLSAPFSIVGNETRGAVGSAGGKLERGGELRPALSPDQEGRSIRSIPASAGDQRAAVGSLPNDSQGVNSVRDRTQAMGLDPDLTWYHGTRPDAEIEAFSHDYLGENTGTKSAELGTWLTSRKDQADTYGKLANGASSDPRGFGMYGPKSKVMDLRGPSRVREFDVLAEAQRIAKENQDSPPRNATEAMNYMGLMSRWVPQLAEEAKKEGFHGLKLKNIRDDPLDGWREGAGVDADHLLVFDPRHIRSVDAAFDPAKADSANLLASNAGDTRTAALGATLEGATQRGETGKVNLFPSLEQKPPKQEFNIYRGVNDWETHPAPDFIPSFWGSTDRNVAESYSTLNEPRALAAKASFENPLIVNTFGGKWDDLAFGNKKLTTDQIAKQAKQDGHDGIVFKNVIDANDEYEVMADTVAALKRGTVFDPNGNLLFSNGGNPTTALLANALAQSSQSDASPSNALARRR